MDWEDIVNREKEKDYYKELMRFLKEEYRNHEVYPEKKDVFAALRLTPMKNVKCVILGQDPYHEPGQAMGLSFSVREGITLPLSLQNIYKEISSEYECEHPQTGDLTRWAEQGVLLLNSILTVRAHEAASHKQKGWETFTDVILEECNKLEQPIVFMLWGNYARSKKSLLTNPGHLVLESAHPSPLSAHRGFFGNGHFKKCNIFLMQNNVDGIKWT